MRYLFNINIPYWFDKQLNIILWIGETENNKRLILTFWLNYKVKDLPGYENDWMLGNGRNFVLWKWKNVRRVNNEKIRRN